MRRECEESGKAAGQEETTKGGGEGLTRPSTESSESVETRLQNFFPPNHCYCQLEGTFKCKFSLKTSYTVSCIFSSYLSSTT